jgi:multidrug efflux pump subunit AcrA (membrane-fusion protein)
MAGRSKFVTYVLPVLAVGMLAAAGYSIAKNRPDKVEVQPAIMPPVQPSLARAEGGVNALAEAQAYIGAAGIVEAASEDIGVGTHAPGVVARVLVKPGDTVRAGQPLFLVDAATAEADLNARRQDLAAAEARLAQTLARVPGLRAAVDVARAGVAAAEADLAEAKDQLASAARLAAGVITDRETTRRRNAAATAQARLDEARGRLAQARLELALYADADNPPAIAVEQAAVAQAKAAVAIAETQLARLTARAPIDGAVLQVNIRDGEFAMTGVLTAPLVVMGRVDPLHVRVDIDEADIPRFNRAAAAYGSIRGDGANRTPLVFVRLDPLVVPKRSLTGAGNERVDTRVMRAVYRFDPKIFPAFPGQQMDVFITAADAGAVATRMGIASVDRQARLPAPAPTLLSAPAASPEARP